MSQQTKPDPGRVDYLAHAFLKKGLKTVHPVIQFAAKMMNPEIREVLEEELGPGTAAHKLGQRIIRAIEDKS